MAGFTALAVYEIEHKSVLDTSIDLSFCEHFLSCLLLNDSLRLLSKQNSNGIGLKIDQRGGTFRKSLAKFLSPQLVFFHILFFILFFPQGLSLFSATKQQEDPWYPLFADPWERPQHLPNGWERAPGTAGSQAPLRALLKEGCAH